MNFIGVFLAISLYILNVDGHGKVTDPVHRGSRWRIDSRAPENYDDHQLYCGGFAVQWEIHNGKCGICGDDYGLEEPRPHELGGRYGQGVIVKTYKQGSLIDVDILITANHRGHFYFDLCHFKGRESNECFKKLTFANGEKLYNLEDFATGLYSAKLKLPENLTCDHCILRWTYVAGNNWGTHKQETFRSCSDVAILESTGETAMLWDNIIAVKRPGKISQKYHVHTVNNHMHAHHPNAIEIPKSKRILKRIRKPILNRSNVNHNDQIPSDEPKIYKKFKPIYHYTIYKTNRTRKFKEIGRSIDVLKSKAISELFSEDFTVSPRENVIKSHPIDIITMTPIIRMEPNKSVSISDDKIEPRESLEDVLDQSNELQNEIDLPKIPPLLIKMSERSVSEHINDKTPKTPASSRPTLKEPKIDENEQPNGIRVLKKQHSNDPFYLSKYNTPWKYPFHYSTPFGYISLTAGNFNTSFPI